METGGLTGGATVVVLSAGCAAPPCAPLVSCPALSGAVLSGSAAELSALSVGTTAGTPAADWAGGPVGSLASGP